MNADFTGATSGKSLSRGWMSHSDSRGTYRVSAIVSTYNAERFMRGCIEDLVSQTIIDDLEIVIIDSGSQQNEKAIVEEFQDRFGNIVYLRTDEREGLYKAWNRAIRLARGRYLTNANTDDRHCPDAMAKMAETLDSHPQVALVYGDGAVTVKENQTWDQAVIEGHFLWPDFDPFLLQHKCYIGFQPMWRKDLHEAYGFFDEQFQSAGDYEFWMRLAAGEDFFHIPEVLGLYLMSTRGIEHRNAQLSVREVLRARARHWPGRLGPRRASFFDFFVPSRSTETCITQVPRRPVVSVLLSSRGWIPGLVQALKSLECQTAKNFEVIILDEGDADIETIVMPFRQGMIIQHLWYPKTSGGLRAFANSGLCAARGEYIAFLDDATIYLPRHIEYLIKAVGGKKCRKVWAGAVDNLPRHALPLGCFMRRLNRDEIEAGYCFERWSNKNDTGPERAGNIFSGEATVAHQQGVPPERDLRLANYLFAQGLKFRSQGRLQQARSCFKSSLAVVPRLISAHHALGRLLLHTGEYPEALRHLQNAAMFDPEAAELFVRCVAILTSHGAVQDWEDSEMGLAHHP